MSKKTEKKITLNQGGSAQKRVAVASIRIPDLWHLAQAQPTALATEQILEVWGLAHDLKNALLNS